MSRDITYSEFRELTNKFDYEWTERRKQFSKAGGFNSDQISLAFLEQVRRYQDQFAAADYDEHTHELLDRYVTQSYTAMLKQENTPCLFFDQVNQLSNYYTFSGTAYLDPMYRFVFSAPEQYYDISNSEIVDKLIELVDNYAINGVLIEIKDTTIDISNFLKLYEHKIHIGAESLDISNKSKERHYDLGTVNPFGHCYNLSLKYLDLATNLDDLLPFYRLELHDASWSNRTTWCPNEPSVRTDYLTLRNLQPKQMETTLKNIKPTYALTVLDCPCELVPHEYLNELNQVRIENNFHGERHYMK